MTSEKKDRRILTGEGKTMAKILSHTDYRPGFGFVDRLAENFSFPKCYNRVTHLL